MLLLCDDGLTEGAGADGGLAEGEALKNSLSPSFSYSLNFLLSWNSDTFAAAGISPNTVLGGNKVTAF